MSKANAGWLYYRQYFKPGVDLVGTNNEIVNTTLEGLPELQSATHRIPVETVYPGLLIGSGYSHDMEGDEAFKVGFYFDHITGMPVIPGSSVKGTIRSLFPQRVLKGTIKKGLSPEFMASREHFIREWLSKNKITVNIDSLEAEIFDGVLPESKRVAPYCRDIFFDAAPTGFAGNNFAPRPGGGFTQQRLFGEDYITPHKHRPKNGERKPELDPFSDPNPIKFLKVLPRVQYEFRFRLDDSKVCPALTAEKKKHLFEHILKTIGIGAKTHVGYGQFGT